MFYRGVEIGDLLLCSKGTEFIYFDNNTDTKCIGLFKRYCRVQKMWISPEKTSIYLLEQKKRMTRSDIHDFFLKHGLTKKTHKVHFHRVGSWMCAVVVTMDQWETFVAQARALAPCIGLSKLYFIDIWFAQQILASTSGEAILHIPGKKYIYCMEQGMLVRKEEKSNDQTVYLQPLEGVQAECRPCYVGSICGFLSIDKNFGFWQKTARFLLTSILLIVLGLLVLAGVSRYRLFALSGPYRLQLQGYVDNHRGVLGHLNESEQWAMSTYFDRVMDPLTEIVHETSNINSMIFNPLTQTMLLVGTIADGRDVAQWMSLKKYDIYKNLEVSMMQVPDERVLTLLDSLFEYNTDAGYDDRSMLMLRSPALFPNFHMKSLKEFMVLLSENGGER